MRAFAKLTWTELKLFSREPIAMFFALAFPTAMLLLFGSIYGNKPAKFFGGRGYIDVTVPAFTAIIMCSTGLVSLPIVVATYRERKILRRFQSTPVPPFLILAAQVIVMFVVTVCGMLVLVAAGKIAYGLRLDGNPALVLAGFTLSCLSIFAIGFVLASVLTTARTAQTVSQAILFPMIFLSGATIPRQVFPSGLRRVSTTLPATHVVTLMQGLWLGHGWGSHARDVLILGVLLVAGVAVSVKTFRWE